METCNRRGGRRGRNHSRQFIPYGAQYSRPGSLLNRLNSFFILSSLMFLVCLMLEYHCSTCAAKCGVQNITKSIDDIANNLSQIQKTYHELEIQISKFALELPKIEGQIEILEAIANTMENKDFGWNPKTQLTMPNVDVYLTKTEEGKNVSHLSSKHIPDAIVLNA